jgi:class 3 adenylate cyclase/tetratricopeptide (TPR) repeat protein/ABC-type branched-subunit amino acid transport system ATPase component
MTSTFESWLHGLGLGQYADAFVREDIGFDVLSELSEANLEALGLSLGHRKVLLRALAERDSDSEVANGELAEELTSWARRAGERKLVTLLFADITGSTALTESLDPEDAHEWLYGAVQRMCETIELHRGTVCRFMGDGVMAMFGAPLAFEDHASQACLAALKLQQVIVDYADVLERDHGYRIEVRVGLHTGEVVVLRVGSAGKEEYDASGPSVALAARMEQTSTPGTVQLTSSTLAMVESRFEAEPLAPVTAKGFSEPIAVFRLVRERLIDEFGHSVNFVGRDIEVDQLRALLESCLRERSGRCVVLCGEPGIGKSSLAERVALSARNRGFRIHRSRALDFGWIRGQDAARLLLRDILEVSPTASEAERARAAEIVVEEGLVELEMRAHLHDLLDLAAPPELEARYAALPATARAEQRQELLATVVVRAAERAPRLLLIEDMHWAQPAIWNYIFTVAEALPDCMAVMLLTARFTPTSGHDTLESALGGLPVVIHGIGPLSPRDAAEFAALFDIDDSAIVEECIERSGRNPLFLEQLLRSRVDGGVGELPGSIQTLVASQLDRLAKTDKHAAQAAAVLGKSFDLKALRAVMGSHDYDCKQLVAQRFVRHEGSRTVFCHALIQEGILASLLHRDRRALHSAAARWFAERDAILHARHLDFADDPDAGRAYLEAARAEVDSYRFTIAEELLTRGLELEPRGEVGIALQLLKGEVLTALGRNIDAAGALRAAADLSQEPAARCRAWLGAAHTLRIVDRYDEGLELLDRAEALAADNEILESERAQIHFVRGTFHFLRIDSEQCERDHSRAYELAKVSGDQEMEAWALTGLVRKCYLTGHFSKAATLTREYWELCDCHGLEYVKYSQIHMMGVTLQLEFHLNESLDYFRESREHAPRIGAPRQAVVGAMQGAHVLVYAGRLSEAAEFARATIELSRRVGERRFGLCAQALLVRAEDVESQPELAERELRSMWDRINDTERRFSGWWILGALMFAASEASGRRWAAQRATEMPLANSYALGRLHFLHDAITASLCAREISNAVDFADQLETLHQDGVTPLAAFHVRAARAAESGDKRALAEVRNDADRAGLVPLAAIVDALIVAG